MEIIGSIALVTGANRGIGRAISQALIDGGASKVYMAGRDAAAIDAASAEVGDAAVPVHIDITNHDLVAAAASACGDINLLINNAGVNFNQPALGTDSMDAARTEIEVNYLGTLDMCRTFAPVLAKSDSSAIVNLLSILARVNLPAIGTYCASKAAMFSLNQAVRGQLRAQGTLVIGAMPGAVDTRLTEGMDMPKLTVEEVAAAVLDALKSETEDIYPGEMATGLSIGLAADAKAIEAELGQMLPG